jgi:hypothetical protein
MAFLMVSFANLAASFENPLHAEKVAMELSFRGLDSSPRKFMLAYKGSTFKGAKSPFVQSLGLQEEQVYSVGLPPTLGSGYAAIEMDGDRAKALYFDLDGDEALSEGERILPIAQEGSIPPGIEWNDQYFITPDMELNTPRGLKLPYRLSLNVFRDGPVMMAYWSPWCVWEGTARLKGVPVRLVLFDLDFNGSFHEFDRDGYSLNLEGEAENDLYISSRKLSRTIAFKQRRYKLNFLGHEGKEGFGVVFESEKLSTSKLMLDVDSANEINPELLDACFRSIDADPVLMYQFDLEPELPCGAYQLDHGYLHYHGDGSWKVSLRRKDKILVQPDTPCRLKFGNPELAVKVFDLLSKGKSGGDASTRFPDDAFLRISREIKGGGEEVYRRFYKKSLFGFAKIEPQLRILNAQGDEVASGRLRYG